MATIEPAPDANPFAASRVAPGKIPYCFPPGKTVQEVLDRLQRHQGWGQILGPHGAGKSTLLATLARELTDRGTAVQWLRVPPQTRSWSHLLTPASVPRGTQVLVDGFEQLSWWARQRLAWVARRRGWGLVVTCHADVGWPTLWEAGVSLATVHDLVERLLRGFSPLVTPADVKAAWETHPTNAREILFALYDVYESRRRARSPAHGK